MRFIFNIFKSFIILNIFYPSYGFSSDGARFQEILWNTIQNNQTFEALKDIDVYFSRSCDENQRALTEYSKNNKKITIKVCDPAFASEKILKSTLFHEMVHVRQIKNGIVTDINVLEREAYREEILFAASIEAEEAFLETLRMIEAEFHPK